MISAQGACVVCGCAPLLPSQERIIPKVSLIKPPVHAGVPPFIGSISLPVASASRYVRSGATGPFTGGKIREYTKSQLPEARTSRSGIMSGVTVGNKGRDPSPGLCRYSPGRHLISFMVKHSFSVHTMNRPRLPIFYLHDSQCKRDAANHITKALPNGNTAISHLLFSTGYP